MELTALNLRARELLLDDLCKAGKPAHNAKAHCRSVKPPLPHIFEELPEGSGRLLVTALETGRTSLHLPWRLLRRWRGGWNDGGGRSDHGWRGENICGLVAEMTVGV